MSRLPESAVGASEEGQAIVKSIRKTHPRYTIEDYLTVFRFAKDAEALLRRNAPLIGIG